MNQDDMLLCTKVMATLVRDNQLNGFQHDPEIIVKLAMLYTFDRFPDDAEMIAGLVLFYALNRFPPNYEINLEELVMAQIDVFNDYMFNSITRDSRHKFTIGKRELPRC
jgi:hypothetical protein